MLKDKWELGWNENAMWLTKGNQKLMFNIKIPTPKGFLFAMFFNRTLEHAHITVSKGTRLSIQKAHEYLGHLN